MPLKLQSERTQQNVNARSAVGETVAAENGPGPKQANDASEVRAALPVALRMEAEDQQQMETMQGGAKLCA